MTDFKRIPIVRRRLTNKGKRREGSQGVQPSQDGPDPKLIEKFRNHPTQKKEEQDERDNS